MATSRARPPKVLDERTATQLAELFDVFSDPSRVRLISVLATGEQNVGTLVEAVGLSTSAVSHQLRMLRQLRLVVARKDGRQVHYSLDEHVTHLYRFGLDHIRHG
jgi:ArsR family transcriptional regulator, lead/cadmium/zinc/bismuth-responsive transcriptional repressor